MILMRRLNSVVEVAKVIGVVFLSAAIIRAFVFQPFVVEGSSMERSYHNGEYLFVEKVSYKIKTPRRGDTIVFRYPRDPRYNYIKRIVGLPGEVLQIRDGNVFVNGASLREDYIYPGQETIVDGNKDLQYEITLENKQYFVLGDNRQHSSDSREWGPLEEKHIIGRSTLVLYPQSSFRAVASPVYR